MRIVLTPVRFVKIALVLKVNMPPLDPMPTKNDRKLTLYTPASDQGVILRRISPRAVNSAYLALSWAEVKSQDHPRLMMFTDHTAVLQLYTKERFRPRNMGMKNEKYAPRMNTCRTSNVREVIGGSLHHRHSCASSIYFQHCFQQFRTFSRGFKVLLVNESSCGSTE